MHCLSRPGAGAAVLGAALLLVAVPARAEHRPTTTTTSTSTSSSSTTTTSTTPTTSTGSTSTSTTSTTESEDTSTTSSTAGATSSTASTTVPTTSTSTTTPLDAVLPPEVQAMVDGYPRTPAGSTVELVAALARVPDAAERGGYGRFPVGGIATWTHDWLYVRHEPALHLHQGTDVFADRGTPVLSPAAGVARVSTGGTGGLAVTVTQPDGTYWYLAHLDATAVETGADVVPGTVVGTVGDSGNARGSSPHVHVEVHPFGGRALDPKPLLDAYAAEALVGAAAFVVDQRLLLLRAGAS